MSHCTGWCLAAVLGIAGASSLLFAAAAPAPADGDGTPPPTTKPADKGEKKEECGEGAGKKDAPGIAEGGCVQEKPADCPDCKTAGTKCEKCVAAEKAAAEKAAADKAAAEKNAAPAFTLKDTNGKEVALKDFKGKVVVLEWVNHGCPYVKKHYGADNMQKLQRKYTGKGVVWLSIASAGEGREGFLSGKEWNETTAAVKAAPTAVLLDADGKVGHLYGAKTTPTMVVIDGAGAIVYRGAIDDNPSPKPATIEGARNYVAEALDALLAGKVPEVKESKSYG